MFQMFNCFLLDKVASQKCVAKRKALKLNYIEVDILKGTSLNTEHQCLQSKLFEPEINKF